MTNAANSASDPAAHPDSAAPDPMGSPSVQEHSASASSPASFVASGSEIAESIMAQLVEVERLLDDAVAQTAALPDETSRHLLRAGGKRVRPILVLLAAQYGDPNRFDVCRAAAAVELIHLATLYHDDVMDDAPVRRGVPAAHEVWGNSVAILTGDLLFARASLLTSQMGPDAVRLQAETFERLVLGQLNEFTGPEGGADPVEHYLQVLSDKTGSLIAAAGEFGLCYASAPAELIPVLRDYGEKVGVAFQLADDIIDLTSAGEESGKTPGTDLREGVPTLPVLYARSDAQAGDARAQHVVDMLEQDLSSDEALTRVCAALAEHPATERARQTARDWSAQAIAALEPLPEGEVKDGLIEFARSVVDRVV